MGRVIVEALRGNDDAVDESEQLLAALAALNGPEFAALAVSARRQMPSTAAEPA